MGRVSPKARVPRHARGGRDKTAARLFYHRACTYNTYTPACWWFVTMLHSLPYPSCACFPSFVITQRCFVCVCVWRDGVLIRPAVSIASCVGVGAFPTGAPTAWHDMIVRSDLLRVETLLVLNSPRQADVRRMSRLVVLLAIGVLRAVLRFRCDRFVPFGRGAPVLFKNQSHPSSPPLPPAPWAIPCCLTREMRSGLPVLFGPGLISMHAGGEGARTVAGVHVRAGNTARLPRERESSPPPFVLVCNSDLVRTLEVVSWLS